MNNGASKMTMPRDTENADMNAFLRRIGAKNVDPPLPRSAYLRNKKTGVVFAWSEMFALQTELMECCDRFGNTDPDAWMPDVKEDIPLDDALLERQVLTSVASKEAIKAFTQNPNATEQQTVVQPKDTSMPNKAVPLKDSAACKAVAALCDKVKQ